VTDDQLVLALIDQHAQCCTTANDGGDQEGEAAHPAGAAAAAGALLRKSDVELSSSVINMSVTGPAALQRQALAVLRPAAATPTAFADILRSLRRRATSGGGGGSRQQQHREEREKRGSVAVPRKGGAEEGGGEGGDDDDDAEWYGAVEMDVECSDPYGREEVDADGRGAPADGLPVPVRKSVVWVCAVRDKPVVAEQQQQQQRQQKHSKSYALQHEGPKTTVLSTAMSTPERLAQDSRSAADLARLCDRQKGIPVGSRLDDLLAAAFPSAASDDSAAAAADAVDRLDVTIAYLRRVHLLSYYSGCAQADTLADLLVGRHAAGTIHVRYRKEEEEEEGKEKAEAAEAAPSSPSADPTQMDDDVTKEGSKPKDLLVQRMDEKIAEALRQRQEWLTLHGEDSLLDAREAEEAARIRKAEQAAQERWLRDHSELYDDGRARCSFRFCHKLFKDSTFLRKHLLKKHVEFCRAEQAKCHDEAMMRSWDGCEDRPVPDILVDTGARLGCVSTPLLRGSSVPDCVDPEPELWRREEERRKREEDMVARREELRQQQRERERPPPSTREMGTTPRSGGGGGFVDVDDMKEEKVELSFDNVEVPVAKSAKKKKKRKLL
jgi:hypothetical protein